VLSRWSGVADRHEVRPAIVHTWCARIGGTIHVVFRLHLERLPTDHKGKVRELLLAAAAPLCVLGEVQRLQDHLQVGMLTHHQGAARVQDALALSLSVLAAHIQRLAIDQQVRELELPIAFLVHLYPLQGRSHPFLTSATKRDFRLILHVATQVDREDGLVHGRRRVGRQHSEDVELGRVADGLAQTHDTVPIRISEGVVGLLGHLNKVGLRTERLGADTEANLVPHVLAHGVTHRKVDHHRIPVCVVLRGGQRIVRPCDRDRRGTFVGPEPLVASASGTVAL